MSMTQGSRRYRRMRREEEDRSPPSKADRASDRSIRTDPRQSAAKKAKITERVRTHKSTGSFPCLLLSEDFGVNDFCQIFIAFSPAFVGLIMEQILGKQFAVFLLALSLGNKVAPDHFG